MAGDAGRAVQRVVAALSPDALATLGSGVAGADLHSFLLAVMRDRAAAVSPAELPRRCVTDRLVEPARVDARALHRTIGAVVGALPSAFELLELSPVAPLGVCSAIATVDQNKVVSTARGTEVAADPTNVLAALAASRAADPLVQLAAVQRVLRAQPMGAAGHAHFSVLGLVVAGRARGRLQFEAEATAATIMALLAAARSVCVAPIEVRVTNLRTDPINMIDDAIRVAAESIPDVTVLDDPARTSGRGYYRDCCYKVVVVTDNGETEIGDGGCTDWMTALTGNRKRRLAIGGLGLDRLAALGAAP